MRLRVLTLAATAALALPSGAFAFGWGGPVPIWAHYPPAYPVYGSFYSVGYFPAEPLFVPSYAPPGTSVLFPARYMPAVNGYPAYLTDGFGRDYRVGYYLGPGWAGHPSHAGIYPAYYR
jgi:hypothetical protein